MISFKEFLIEAGNYPLYHGTTLESLHYLIRDNVMETNYADANSDHPLFRRKTVSFSRSKKFAKYWSKRIGMFRGTGTNTTAVIEIDREMISRNYKIVPYNHFSAYPGSRANIWAGRWAGGHPKSGREHEELDMTQFEERIPAPIKNINKYIVKIYMSKASRDHFKETYFNEYETIKDRIVIE